MGQQVSSLSKGWVTQFSASGGVGHDNFINLKRKILEIEIMSLASAVVFI